MLVVGTCNSVYACCMVVYDSLFVAMLMPYSLMTCIKIYFIRNTIFTIPSGFGTTHFFVLHAEVK